MSETKSEWTPTHPKAIGQWVCADGVKRWVAGRAQRGTPVIEMASGSLFPIIGNETYPIRPYVETKKIEVEAWAVIRMDGVLLNVHTTEKAAEYLTENMEGTRTVVRLTGTVEIEA